MLKLYTTESFVLLIVIYLVEVFSLVTCCCHNTQLKNLILGKCVTNRLVSCLARRNTYRLIPETNRLNVIYAMKSKGTLMQHILTHTKELSYSCTQCDYSCSQIFSPTRHIRTPRGEKPYNCDVFSKLYANSDNLYKHKQTHAKGKPFKCDQCNKRSLTSTLKIDYLECNT